MGTHGQQGKAPPLRILSGQTQSNVLGGTELGDFVSVLVHSPATLDGGTTYTFYVHPEKGVTAAASGWRELQDRTGNPIEAPAAGTSAQYPELLLAGSVKIVASGAVGDDREWAITGIRTV